MVLPVSPSLPPLAARALRILVVDDDPIMLAMAETWLSNDGNIVGTARDGVEAMDALGDQRFDLVLLDLEMPVMNGFDVLSELRADARYVDVPVIVATSRSDTAAIDEAYRRGATSFVVKPVVWELLVRQIRYVFNAERLKRGFEALEEALADRGAPPAPGKDERSARQSPAWAGRVRPGGAASPQAGPADRCKAALWLAYSRTRASSCCTRARPTS